MSTAKPEQTQEEKKEQQQAQKLQKEEKEAAGQGRHFINSI